MILSGKTIIAGVLGWPIGHSLSPRLHSYWLESLSIDGVYLPLDVSPEDFEQAVRALPRLGFAGANVTAPHKEAALAAVDTNDNNALRIGAVNTIVCKADGTLYGSNTDGYGFLENLSAGCLQWTADQGSAVVLGAGGAARAVVGALVDSGVPEVRLVNRTRSRAEALARDIGGVISVIDWKDLAQALRNAALLVNTTKLGMKGSPPLTVDLAPLPSNAVVTDIVYTPIVTELLRQARARGNPVVDGLGMLLHQARPGFAAWFGIEPEVSDELRTFVFEEDGA